MNLSYSELVIWFLFGLYPFLAPMYKFVLGAFHVLYLITKWKESKHHPSTDRLPGRKGFFTAYVNAYRIFRGYLFELLQEIASDGNPIHRIDLPMGVRLYLANYYENIKIFHQTFRASLDAPDGVTDGGPVMVNFMETIGGAQIFKLPKEDFIDVRTRFREETNGGVLPRMLGSIYEETTPRLVAHIEKAIKENGGVVYGEYLIREFVFTALSHILFSGYRFEDAIELGDSLEYVAHTIFHRMCLMPALMAAIDPTARRAIRVMNETSKKVLDKCKEEILKHPDYDPNADAETRKATNKGMGVVAKLYGFMTKSGNYCFDDAQSLDLVTLIMVAGYDTSSSFLSHVLYHAAKHPEVMEAIRADLHRLTEGRFDDLDVMRESKVLDSFYLECSRMTGASSLQSRRIINKNFVLQQDPEIILSPGDTVFLNNWYSHRDPKHYTNPNEFIADRFVSSTEKNALETHKVSKDAKDAKDRIHTMHPFSRGMNECPGRFTVREEVLVLLIFLATHYKLEALNDPPSKAAISFRPEGHVMVRFTPLSED